MRTNRVSRAIQIGLDLTVRPRAIRRRRGERSRFCGRLVDLGIVERRLGLSGAPRRHRQRRTWPFLPSRSGLLAVVCEEPNRSVTPSGSKSLMMMPASPVGGTGPPPGPPAVSRAACLSVREVAVTSTGPVSTIGPRLGVPDGLVAERDLTNSRQVRRRGHHLAAGLCLAATAPGLPFSRPASSGPPIALICCSMSIAGRPRGLDQAPAPRCAQRQCSSRPSRSARAHVSSIASAICLAFRGIGRPHLSGDVSMPTN